MHGSKADDLSKCYYGKNVKGKCDVTLLTSFLKVYTKMEACSPPRITKFEADVDVDKLLCEGRGNGKLTMQIIILQRTSY